MVINGPCWCMQIKNLTLKSLGMGCSKAIFLPGSVLLINPPFLLFTHWLQAYRHIFTSPSSVEKEVKATRSGNAHIHGMTRVTPASLAYIATPVRDITFLSLRVFESERLASFAFHCHCHHHRCSAGQTPQQIRSDSMRASWIS